MDLRKLLELLRVRDSTLFICIPHHSTLCLDTVSADVCEEKEGKRGEERREERRGESKERREGWRERVISLKSYLASQVEE